MVGPMVNPLNKTIYGYTGLFRQPFSNGTFYGNTLFAITNESHSELNLLILSDGFFMDAYRIASQPTYQKVNIFVPFLNVLFISDLFRLVTTLKKLKEVMWYHPSRYTTENPQNVLFEVTHNRANVMTSSSIYNLIIRMIPASCDINDMYDFDVSNGKDKFYFTLGSSKKYIESLITSKKYDTIHLPYNTYYAISTSGRELVEDDRKLSRYLCANNFNNVEEYNEMMCSGFALLPRLMSN